MQTWEGRDFHIEGLVTVNEYRTETKHVPGTTYFPADADGKENQPVTELQGVSMEGWVDYLHVLCTWGLPAWSGYAHRQETSIENEEQVLHCYKVSNHAANTSTDVNDKVKPLLATLEARKAIRKDTVISNKIFHLFVDEFRKGRPYKMNNVLKRVSACGANSA